MNTTELWLGFSLGLSSGLAPGPLLFLVIHRAVRYGFGSGLRVALAPILTDLPIIALSVWLVGILSPDQLWILSLVGGLFVVWLGIDGFRRAGSDPRLRSKPSSRDDWIHGMIVNFVNPHPYLFWGLVGAPTVVNAWRGHPTNAVGFLLLFYGMLVGSKIAIAWFVARAGSSPGTRFRIGLERVTSALLLGAGLLLVFRSLVAAGYL